MPDSAARSTVRRSVDRTMERRRAAYEDEVRRLIEAGFHLVRSTGKLEPTVGEIVSQAGLSNQAFYRHFRSKDELLLAMLEEGIETLGGYLEHRMQKARTPERRIRSWIEGILEQALSDESAPATRPFAMARARLSELFPREVNEAEAKLTASLRVAIEEAAAAGVAPHADPERDPTLVYQLAMGWVERKLADPEPARRADAEHLVDFAMHGLRRGEGS